MITDEENDLNQQTILWKGILLLITAHLTLNNGLGVFRNILFHLPIKLYADSYYCPVADPGFPRGGLKFEGKKFMRAKRANEREARADFFLPI